jgi:hypothetical protein
VRPADGAFLWQSPAGHSDGDIDGELAQLCPAGYQRGATLG